MQDTRISENIFKAYGTDHFVIMDSGQKYDWRIDFEYQNPVGKDLDYPILAFGTAHHR